MPQRLFFLPLFALVVMFAVPVGDAVAAYSWVIIS